MLFRSELPGGAYLREGVVDRALLSGKAVLWRNYEASADAASLEPRSRRDTTYLLQEYFVPPANFLPFVKAMAGILARHRVNALNVSIRHAPADTVSLLKWAAGEVFSFVIYYKQGSRPSADAAAGARPAHRSGCGQFPARPNGEAVVGPGLGLAGLQAQRGGQRDHGAVVGAQRQFGVVHTQAFALSSRIQPLAQQIGRAHV